jgi:hypothetical protein
MTPPTTGLRLWLRGAAGITQAGGLGSGWADQSGNGNNVAQAIGVNQPAVAASSINGKTGLTFGAGKYLINTTSNLVAAGAARTVYAVCRSASAANQQAIIAFRQPDLTFTTPNFNLTLPGVAGGRAYIYTDFVSVNQRLATNPTILNQSVLYEWAFDGVLGHQITFRMNGVLVASDLGQVSNAEATATGFVIGADLYSSDYLQGDLCELLVYNAIQSPTDATATRAYAASEYALAIDGLLAGKLTTSVDDVRLTVGPG